MPPNLFLFMNAAIRKEVWVPKNVLEIDVEKDGGFFFELKFFGY